MSGTIQTGTHKLNGVSTDYNFPDPVGSITALTSMKVNGVQTDYYSSGAPGLFHPLFHKLNGVNTVYEMPKNTGFGSSSYPQFKTKWNTENLAGTGSPTKTIRLPIPYSGKYVVDWGDGQIDAEKEHVYATGGIYDVTMYGPVDDWTFYEPSFVAYDSEKLVAVEEVAGLALQQIGTFLKCKNMVWNATDTPYCISNLVLAFFECRMFNSDINNWDVSKVTNFGHCFRHCDVFNQDLSNWDMSSATNIETMFTACLAFNQDLSSWDVSNITNMFGTFATAKLFNQDLSSWDVSNVTTMYAMFSDAEAFVGTGIDSWDVSSVTNMRGMFGECLVFNTDIDSWDVSNVTNMESMFRNAVLFNQGLNSWDVGNVTDFSFMFAGALAYNQSMSSWDMTSATTLEGMVSYSPFNQDISAWSVPLVTTMSTMLDGTNMSTANYGSWLISLDGQSIQSGITLGAQGITYALGSAAATARANLTTNDNMTFVGDSGV